MGILGKQTTVSGTDVLLYKCPVGKQAVFAVNAVNTGVVDGKITMSLLKDADLAVESIIMAQKGTGLTSIPTLTIDGASTTTATAEVVTVGITELNALVGGSGYLVGNVLTLEGGTANEAATATVSAVDANGTVTAVTSITGGDYSAVITGTDASTTTDSEAGTGCTFTVSGIAYGINTVTVTDPGNGYLAIPTISVSAGTGFQFTVATSTIVEVTDAIEYNTVIYKDGVGLLERSGIIFGAGDQLFIKSDVSTINVIAVGLETLA